MFKTFLTLQFNGSPLVWMCHSWTFNRIYNIHHRALRIVYQDKKSSFEKLLQKDKSVSVHMKHLQYLPTEIFKVKNDLSPLIMNEVLNFQENESYNLRSGTHLASWNMHTAHFGTGTIFSSGPKLWKVMSDKIKHVWTLSAFKDKNKSWTITNCPCRLHKILVKVFILLKFVQVSNEIHTSSYVFFLKTRKKCLK